MLKFYTRTFYSLLVIVLFSNSSFAQNCEIQTLDDITNPGLYTVATYSDGLRDGPDYGSATVYYPTDATPPYASVVIVPGFLSAPSSVADWGPFLASHGIVAMVIGTNSGWDQPAARADGLLDAIETLRQENTRMGSPLFSDLDITKFAVSGWSMGGGGAQLAAVADPSIKAVVALCPWLSSPDPGELDHAVPLLILSGENDPTAPPSSHANVHYNLTPATTDKLLFEAAGGNHSVANDPANVQGDIGKIALSWYKHYLLEESCYCPFVLDAPTSSSSYLVNLECPAANAPCAIPSNIAASPKGGNVAQITWDAIDPAANVEKYEVRYRPVGGTWTEGVTRINYRWLNDLQLNTTYQYQVKSFCPTENSVWSTTQTFTTLVDACDRAQNVAVVDNADGSATVSWDADPSATKYKIAWRFAGADWTYVYKNAPLTSMELTGLTGGINHLVKVKSKCAAGWTNYSTKATWQPISSRFNEQGATDFAVFPNPATSELTIYSESLNIVSYSIFNMLGQEVKSIPLESRTTAVAISDLPKGMYNVTARTADDQMLSKKLIKQ